jgi:ABC-2 type transport system ATP-binding protein
MNHAIELNHVDAQIDGKLILSNISANVPNGQIVGLLGPSGAGKTILMRVILGLQRMSEGKASVLGKPAGSPVLRSQIGYVTQAPAVYDDLTVRENLRYFAAMIGASQSRVGAAMEDVGLAPHSRQLVRTLSGGERSRLSLAVALLNRPALLVMDEPTVGLDPVLRRDLWAHFRKLAAAGSTLLISSHVMDEAKKCDSLILLREGTVLATGTPDELTAHTRASDFDGAFLRLVEERQGL